MQKVIENSKNLFDENGEVTFGGWSKAPVFEYNKSQSASSNKIWEHDCYYISNNHVGLYISVETQGFELAIKIVLANFRRGRISSDYVVKKFILSPQNLPQAGTVGEFSYTDKRIALTLTNTVDGRYIKCDFIDFANFKNLYVKILVKKINGESLNLVAPFDNTPRNFYFKRFVPKFTATGVVMFGGTQYNFTEDNSFVYLDWSRYCLPRKHKYQTMSGVFELDGKRFAINLGSRVGNNKKGSENCFFIDGKLYKIGRVRVTGDDKRFDRCWYFATDNQGVDLVFTPKVTDGDLMSCKCDKNIVVFGKLNGYLHHKDIGEIRLKDKTVHMIFTTL